MRKRRHCIKPGRVLAWCSVSLCLILLLCLALFRQAAVRLCVSAMAVPVFFWTGSLLRWRINGNLKEALTWSFLSGMSGIAVWVFTR